MRPDELAEGLEFLLARTPALPGRIAGAILIANPRAGGFTRPSYARKRHAELSSLRERAARLEPRADPIPLDLRLTDRQGHASALAHEFFAASRPAPGGASPAGEASSSGGKDLRLVVTAGGDGTSLETLAALMELPREERSRYLVLRLPFGTGNDGSDGRELETALGRFLGACAPGARPAIRLSPGRAGGKAPIWAFNIASLGADAFIAHMTNRLKTSFPGDSYKIWVDVASVVYDLLWPTRVMSVAAFAGSGAPSRSFERACLLLAFGASGRRQYGSNKPILPGDENVCVVSQMSLWRKLAVKGPLQRGRHSEVPEAELFSADRLELRYDAPVLFQADGEIVRLEPADFPAVLERLPDSYNVLAPA